MKIFCVGRNYKDHIKELNNKLPENPVVFMKPDTALLRNSEFYLPEFSENIQQETELVVKISKTGKNIPLEFAKNYYKEIALGIDFTARDLQNELKEKGYPWEISKAFDYSAFVGDFLALEEFAEKEIEFTLFKNKIEQQFGKVSQMIFSVDEIIRYISQYFTIKIGDLIFTGTPAGVSTLKEGDFLEGYILNKKNFELMIR